MLHLQMNRISKSYGDVHANKQISFEVAQGEIHALVGENGAGKSTLMKILYGQVQPDSGTIALNGKFVVIDSPNTAIRLGIGMVHQHFQLVPSFTVAENVVLGSEPQARGFLNEAEMIAQVQALADRFNLKVDAKKRVQDLSVGVQQRVEILKLLYRDAQLLILDEPSAVLTPQEVESLFFILRGLVTEGRTVIFITHKLHEVMQLCQRATVLRRGEVIGTVNVADTSPPEIARMMVGKDVEPVRRSGEAQRGAVQLSVDAIYARDDRRLPALRGISFSICGGEIVGLAGIEGNGQRELLEVLVGLRSPTDGTVSIGDLNVTHHPGRERREHGLAIIPEDRNHEGLSGRLSISENVAGTRYYRQPFSNWGMLQAGFIRRATQRLMDQFDIRAESPKTPVGSLSGGNAQKVVIARELADNPLVLIAAQPTRGLDIGAATFVHEQLLQLRAAGCGILLLSADLDELLAMCDRFLVLYEGQIIGQLNAEDATREELGALMAGGGVHSVSAI